MKLSLKNNIRLGLGSSIILFGLLSSILGVWIIHQGVKDMAQNKARLDLNSARLIYHQGMDQVGEAVRVTSLDPLVRRLAMEERWTELLERLRKLREREGLDILNLTLPHGTFLRARTGQILPEKARVHPIVRQISGGKSVVVSTSVLSQEELLAEGEDLAQRARIFISPQETVEDGLMIMGASSFLDGQAKGAIYGGILLNNSQKMVDQIKETIYEGETYEGRSVGEGTITLGDVRVTTNAILEGGKRAIGTRVDPAVSQTVLERGEPYIEQAIVVDDRHYTAYEPIKDLSGRVVAILSLGIPAKRFEQTRNQAIWIFMLVTLGGILVAIVVGGLIARTLSKPLLRLAHMARLISKGELDVPIDEGSPIVEVDLLAQTFNAMIQAIREKDQELLAWTQRKVGEAERLAMIGRLAAGVAHEINNPIGGILLFSHLLLRKAEPESKERENLERIAREAKRCQKIVQGLLDFARKREPVVEPLSLPTLMDRSLELVENQALFQNIAIKRDYSEALPSVMVDGPQIQQVLVNIITNAADAMEGRGTLSISIRQGEGDRVEAVLQDSGCGISPEDQRHLFEPFFTTKEVGKGTGLGLSISQGILANHGGTISVESELGQGATFRIVLPAIKEEP